MSEPTITSHHLAKVLLKLPDLPVVLEGCDCFGDAIGVTVYKDDITVRRDGGALQYDKQPLIRTEYEAVTRPEAP